MEPYLSTISESVSQTCQITLGKCIAALSIIVAHMVFGKIDIAVLFGVGVLTIFDFFTALAKEYKLGNAIKSKKAVRTPLKMMVYAIMIAAGYVTESVIGIHVIDIPIAQTIAAFIAVTELVSILENVGRMGYVIPTKLLNSLEEFTGKAKKH